MARYRLITCVTLWTFTWLSLAANLRAEHQLKIISFTAERCEPCRSMQPALVKLAREGWHIRQVDVQQQAQLVEAFKVQSLPTIVVQANGREVDRIVGALGYEKLKARLESADAAQSMQPNSLQTVRGQSPAPERLDFAEISPATDSSVQPAFTPNPSASLPPRSPEPMPVQQAVAVAPRSTVDPVARAQQATVRIKIEDANSIAFGTGTVINVHNQQALVLTCGHMFRGVTRNAQISVDVFAGGRTINVPAQIVSYEAEEGDIGLMEFRLPVAIDPVPIARVAPQLESPAFSFGCDHGADPTRRDTKVKRINRFQGPANIEIYGAPVLGRSGGGLFDAQGNIIGVCNAADNEDDEGLYAALPVIQQHVAALKLDSLPSAEPLVGLDQPTAQPQIQLASAISSATKEQPGYWPDEKFAAAPAAVNQASANSATQVRCVIRDAQGKESALLIERPSEELVALLRSQSR